MYFQSILGQFRQPFLREIFRSQNNRRVFFFFGGRNNDCKFLIPQFGWHDKLSFARWWPHLTLKNYCTGWIIFFRYAMIRNLLFVSMIPTIIVDYPESFIECHALIVVNHLSNVVQKQGLIRPSRQPCQALGWKPCEALGFFMCGIVSHFFSSFFWGDDSSESPRQIQALRDVVTKVETRNLRV